MVESAAPETARELYRTLEAAAPSDPTLLRLIGSLAERAGDYEPAADAYRRATGVDRSLNLHGDAGRALRLAGRLDESEAELTEALRLVPGDPRAHFEMALLLEARGDLDGAAEQSARRVDRLGERGRRLRAGDTGADEAGRTRAMTARERRG